LLVIYLIVSSPREQRAVRRKLQVMKVKGYLATFLPNLELKEEREKKMVIFLYLLDWFGSVGDVLFIFLFE